MISLIVPAYNESTILNTLYQRVAAAAAAWGDTWELLLIDDGSRDDTLAIAAALASADPRVKVLSFSRNFGHQPAVTAGLEHAKGDIIAVIDADLQDPPEELLRFIDKCREGYDVVYAIRTKRKEGPLKRSAYFLYYRLLRQLSAIEIPLDTGDFCVMSRRILDVINSLPERTRFIRGLRSWSGFRQIGLPYERHARLAGEPKYTFTSLVKLGLDGVLSFSYKPLHLLMLAGGGIGALAFLGGFLSFVLYVSGGSVLGYNPRDTPGWTSLIIVILFMAGVQMFSIGLLGAYIGRIFEESKGRPVYVIGKTINL